MIDHNKSVLQQSVKFIKSCKQMTILIIMRIKRERAHYLIRNNTKSTSSKAQNLKETNRKRINEKEINKHISRQETSNEILIKQKDFHHVKRTC